MIWGLCADSSSWESEKNPEPRGGGAHAWGHLLYPPALVLVREKGQLVNHTDVVSVALRACFSPPGPCWRYLGARIRARGHGGLSGWDRHRIVGCISGWTIRQGSCMRELAPYLGVALTVAVSWILSSP